MGEFNHTRYDYNYNLKFKGLNISEPIFTKFDILASRLNSVVSTKLHPIWANIRRLVHNKRTKLYMGAISKSEPISIKFSKCISELYLIYFPKYRCCIVHITAAVDKNNKSDEQYILEL